MALKILRGAHTQPMPVQTLGDHPELEMPLPVLDELDRFGAGFLYQKRVAFPYKATPWANRGWTLLQASTKPSEHNIWNTVPVIVVAQLPQQMRAPSRLKIYSHRIRLPEVIPTR